MTRGHGPTDASLSFLTHLPIAAVTRLAIGSFPVTRPLVSIYLHTCAKLIKAELIQVLVIF